MPPRQSRRRYLRAQPIPRGEKKAVQREVCLELQDQSVVEHSAVKFFGLEGNRDPYPQAARLAEQFAQQNRALFSLMDVRVDGQYDGNDVVLRLTSGDRVGAIPLYSPTSAAPDYGLVVQPRFPWRGIGPMLADMGWRVAPTPLKLPLLHRSERRVPAWVLSSMILARLQALLESLTRRFETTTVLRTAPRGRVQWDRYAHEQLPCGQFLAVPCTYPDLRDDSILKGAIRYALEKQLRVLQTQVGHGAFVHRLIELCEYLLMKVRVVVPMLPPPSTFQQWLQRPMRTTHFLEGLQAIEWTADDRGLAGVSDLEGIPWAMPMNEFFEAFVETVLQGVARRLGGQLKVGRRRETSQPISWSPPFVGSQRSLVPDLWLEWQDTTLIVDAKYKRHWEELQDWHRQPRHVGEIGRGQSWQAIQDQIHEQHRVDLFQVLAYANLARTPRVIVCLSYPCAASRWRELREADRLIHQAEIPTGSRSLQLWLTAVPMGLALADAAVPIENAFRRTATGVQLGMA